MVLGSRVEGFRVMGIGGFKVLGIYGFWGDGLRQFRRVLGSRI